MSKIIYCLQIYSLPEQVQQLINRLDDYNVIFVINVSSLSNIANFKFFARYSELYYVNDALRVKVYWGGYSQVQQTLNSFIWITNNITDYTHVILLSETTYPIKNSFFISEFFRNNKEKSFFRFSKIGDMCKWKNPIYRLNRLYLYDLIKFNRNNWAKKIIINIFKKIKVNNIINYKLKFFNYDIYAGSNWFSINKKMLEYVINFINCNDKFLKLFKYAGLADEIFFHTILLNSKYSKDIVNYNYLYVDWSDKTEWPKVFRINDFHKLSKIPHFFARKFNMNVDRDILDKIDNCILGV